MEFSQRSTLTAADWQEWVGRNVAVRDGGLGLDKRAAGDAGADGATDGVAYRQFDAGSEAVQWHRLVVDHSQPTAGTQLRVAYYASDEPTPIDEPLADLCGLSASTLQEAGVETIWELLACNREAVADSWDRSADEIQQAQTEAAARLAAATADEWQLAGSTEEILLASATGRYLTVRIELVGTPRSSPRVESVRASWPRQSYLQYLPELYQTQNEAFLEQFLSVFGTLFTDIEREIETVTEYLDPQAVPADALGWLAEWLGVEAPAEWPTPAVRKRIGRAPDHQPTRGTKDGLRNMLGLYLAHIEPAEPLDADRLVPTENTAVGMDVDMDRVDHGLWILEAPELDEIGPAATDAYRRPFSAGESVVVYAGPFERPEHRTAAERIVDRETPAHVESRLVELTGDWRLGVDGFLGETTRLGDRAFELGGTRLGATAELD